MNTADLTRRLDNLLRQGTIYATDPAKARCRVKSGSLLTDWLPYFVHRAGSRRDVEHPTTGEQCLVLSPSGVMAAGLVLVGINSDQFPAPHSNQALHSSHFSDGAVISYNRETHTMTATLPAGGSATINAPAGVQIIGDVSITGTVTVSEDVTASGISLVNHVHSGVERGNANTDAPA
jgi:phage baseplate assembly protein V